MLIYLSIRWYVGQGLYLNSTYIIGRHEWGLELARKTEPWCPSFAQRGIPIGCEPAQVIGWSLPLLWASLPSQADLIIYILKVLIDVERFKKKKKLKQL